MTPTQTALTRTAAMLGTALAVGIAINTAFAYFTVVQIGIGFTFAMLAYLIYTVYTIELDRAKLLEELNKSVDQ